MASFARNGKYYSISFYNSNRAPKRKYFYYKQIQHYPQEGYTAKQVQDIKRDLEYKYKHGEWDPWKIDQQQNDKSLLLSTANNIFEEKESKRLAPNTVENRMIMLRALVREYGDLDLMRLPENYWDNYINEPKNFASKENRRTVIYGLYKRLAREGYDLPLNIDMEGKAADKKLRSIVTQNQWITEEEMKLVAGCIEEFAKSRSKAKHSAVQPSFWMKDVIELAFYTGMRRADLFAIRSSWVSEDNRIIRIGGDYRPKSQLPEEVIPTIPQARPILARIKAQTPEGETFFQKHSAEYSSKKFKALARYALPHKAEQLWFHCLRHSFVMFCMDELKLRDRLIQQLTRHKDPRSLAKYKHNDVHSALKELDILAD